MPRHAALLLALALAACAPRPAAAPAAAPDSELHARFVRGDLRPVGRVATRFADGARRGIRLDERPGQEGLLWLDSLPHAPAVLEVELRGQDVAQRSFLGLAFGGADDGTYEAVYLRPFNFAAADSTARAHAVQYVAHPDFTWSRLRRERPGAFEAAVASAPSSAPDPDGWHRLRLTIRRDSVHAALDGRPVLAVPRLRAAGGRVGLFVGAGSGGDFTGFRATTGG